MFANTKGFASTTPFGGTGSVFSQSTGFTFGAQQPSATPTTGSGLFGASTFGQPQTTQTTGLFGTQPQQPGQTSGGIFGSAAPASNVFGAKPAFGATGTGFGGATTTSLFGAAPPAAPNAAAPSGLFGAAAPSTGGLFGAAAGAAPGGTVTKFIPPTSTDTAQRSGSTVTVNTKHQCITAMKEYENKSLEELRLEDYLANRKGPQTGAAPGGSIFGSATAQPAGTTAFGSTFGAPAASTSSIFGSANQSSGLFGATAQKPLFGGATTTTQTSSVFGSAAKPLFGATAPTTGGTGLFGAAPAATASTGFTFGQTSAAPANATGGAGLFGAKSTFGATTGTGFGTATTGAGAATGGGLFGTNTGTGLFGAAKTSGFGFGTTTTATTAAPAAPFSFGGAAPSTGGGLLFGGANNQANKPATFGFANSAAPAAGATQPFGQTLFGQPAASAAATNRPLFGGATGGSSLGFNFGAGQSSLLGGAGGLGGPLAGVQAQAQQPPAVGLSANPDEALAQQARIQQQVLDLVVNLPYGHSSLFRNVDRVGAAGSVSQAERRGPLPIPTNPESQRAATQQMKLNVSSRSVKPKTRPLGVVASGGMTGSPGLNASGRRQLFSGLDEEELARADTFFVRRSDWMKLQLPSNSANSSICTEPPPPAPPQGPTMPSSTPVASRRISSDVAGLETPLGAAVTAVSASAGPVSTPLAMPSLSGIPSSPDGADKSGSGGTPHDISCWRGPEDDDPSMLVLPDSSSPPCEPHPCGVLLTKAGYYTIPSLEEIAEQGLDAKGRCLIDNLVVGHKGYGRVLFLGVTDVVNLDIDAAVHIRRKEITVYPDDETKPPEGSGLNKRAEVTLIGVWPTDKTTGEPIKDAGRLDQMHFSDKLERATAKMGARFIEYQPDSGSWVFEVKHFSKYRYDDSDEESDEEAGAQAAKSAKTSDSDKGAQAMELPKEKLPDAANQGYHSDLKTVQEVQEKQDVVNLVRAHDDDAIWSAVSGKEIDDVSSSEGDAAGFAADGLIEELPPWHHAEASAERITAMRLAGISSQNVQLMKASFFGGMELTEEEMDLDTINLARARDRRVDLDEDLTGHPCDTWYPKRQRLFNQLSPNASAPTGVTSAGRPLGAARTPLRRPLAPRASVSPLNASLLGASTRPEPVLEPPGLERECESHRLLPTSLRLPIPAELKRPVLGAETEYSRLYLDPGLMHGSTCRVGWAADLVAWPPVLVEPKSAADVGRLAIGLGGSGAEGSLATRVTLATAAQNLSISERLLNLSLDNSEMKLEGECPIWRPKAGRGPLAAYDSQLPPGENRLKPLRRVVDLCSALWGDLRAGGLSADLSEDGITSDLCPEDSLELDREQENSLETLMERKEALSTWLREQAAADTEAEVAAAGGDSARAAFSWLVGGRLTEAREAAQRGGEHRLAILLAQARGSDCVRRLLIRQMEEWREVGMDSRISLSHLRIYALLAGHMTWTRSCPEGFAIDSSRSDGAPDLVNVCDGLDWTRAFAVHLWFHCAFEQDIVDALRAYKTAFRHEGYAAAPLPPESGAGGDGSGAAHWDAAYHLLQLYCKRCHRLETLLCPQTLNSSPHDWEGVWHLWRLLTALGYAHLAPARQAQLHTEFADQLERAGMWEWAAFVLLHLPDASRRCAATRALLDRRVGEAEADVEAEAEAEGGMEVAGDRECERERFLVERLRVPPLWIYEAKAICARFRGDPVAEARLWTAACRWEEAHSVLMTEVLPKLVPAGDVEQIRDLLLPLSESKAAMGIRTWEAGGRLFLDWAAMRQVLRRAGTRKEEEEEDADMEGEGYQLERARHDIPFLCERLDQLRVKSVQEKLCRSVMALDCARVLRRLVGEYGPGYLEQATRLLSQLPLPEDDRLTETRFLKRARMGLKLSAKS